MSEILFGTHIFSVNPENNGGESLTITTRIFDNGDATDNVFLTQEISLESYSNSASFNLCGAVLTPEILDKLSKELTQQITLCIRKRPNPPQFSDTRQEINYLNNLLDALDPTWRQRESQAYWNQVRKESDLGKSDSPA